MFLVWFSKQVLEKKDGKIYVGRSTTGCNLLFAIHKLCTSYVIKTFLLVSFSVSSKQLTIVFCAGSRPKKRTIRYNKELCRVS